MNVLLLTSHSIAEHDDLDMFTRMGVPTFSIGAYTDPHFPTDDKRPALPDAPHFPEFEALCHEQRAKHGGHDARFVIDWAKGDLHPDIIAWADVIIVHHFPEAWIGGNWDAIRDKRVIWRTCGQSDPRLEAEMLRYRRAGMQIVRYSPREAPSFTAVGSFAGQDAMIRFGKDPDVWAGWTGDGRWIANVTQNMRQRGDACGYGFWAAATEGLLMRPAGPGSEVLPGGLGSLDYDAMRQYLRDARAYLYTGTQPASYTLGLIEAMMTGTPVVTVGPRAFGMDLFEPLAPIVADRPVDAAYSLRKLLEDRDFAVAISERGRARAIELFDIDKVSREWAAFLGNVA